MSEIWKDIKGYEGRYRISNTGKIKSLPRNYYMPNGSLAKTKEKILIARPNNKGYLIIGLRKLNDKKRAFTVHRLVALYFVGNPDNLSEVNHNDGNKSNCAASNLSWTTSKKNKEHAVNNGLYKNGGAHYKSKLIIDLQTGIFYDCIREASFAKGLTKDQLKRRLSGKIKISSQLMYV